MSNRLIETRQLPRDFTGGEPVIALGVLQKPTPKVWTVAGLSEEEEGPRAGLWDTCPHHLLAAPRPSQPSPRARDGGTWTQTHTITPPLSHPELGTQVTHPRSQGDPLRPLPTCTSTGRAPRHEATSRQLRPPPREGSLASFRMCDVPKSSRRGHSSPTRSWGTP